jgi:hypothetical protein
VLEGISKMLSHISETSRDQKCKMAATTGLIFYIGHWENE